MEELVIGKACKLFYTYGLKSVAMDDIAREAGVSKKTIYQAFNDKNELVKHALLNLLKCQADAIALNKSEAKNPVDEVLQTSVLPYEALAGVNKSFFYEIKKFFPDLWLLVEDHKKQVLLAAITHNLQTGKLNGFYRSDLDVRITTAIRFQQIITLPDCEAFSNIKFSEKQLLLQLSLFYLHAITTTKGKKIIDTYLTKKNEN